MNNYFFRSFLQRLFDSQPFTLRGLTLGIVVLFVLIVPSFGNHDIIATIVGWAFFSFLLAATFTSLFTFFRLRGGEGIKLGTPTITESLFPESPVRISLLFSLSVPIGFFLEGTPIVSQDESELTSFLLGGGKHSGEHSFMFRFPHRGEWIIRQVKYTLRDRLGLTSLTWRSSIPPVDIRVVPPEPYASPFPLFSSTGRPGETLPDTSHREGDPLEVRPYHPADGMRKIAWKLFARSGDLFTRIQEPSLTPEGEVVMFIIAGKRDDKTCGHALAYTSFLHDHEVEILAQCQGGGHLPSRTKASLEELLIKNVWTEQAPERLEQEIKEFLATVKRSSQAPREVRNIIFFISETKKNEKETAEALLRTAASVQNQAITPIFFIIEEGKRGIRPAPSMSMLGTWFFETRASARNVIERNSPFFEHSCASLGWEILRNT